MMELRAFTTCGPLSGGQVTGTSSGRVSTLVAFDAGRVAGVGVVGGGQGATTIARRATEDLGGGAVGSWRTSGGSVRVGDPVAVWGVPV